MSKLVFSVVHVGNSVLSLLLQITFKLDEEREAFGYGKSVARSKFWSSEVVGGEETNCNLSLFFWI